MRHHQPASVECSTLFVKRNNAKGLDTLAIADKAGCDMTLTLHRTTHTQQTELMEALLFIASMG